MKQSLVDAGFMSKPGYVYILANSFHNVLYVGVTSDLYNRIEEHKQGKFAGFTKKYHVNQLVYFEEFEDISEAILREKQLKAGSRAKKLTLVTSINPNWNDLFFNLEDI